MHYETKSERETKMSDPIQVVVHGNGQSMDRWVEFDQDGNAFVGIKILGLTLDQASIPRYMRNAVADALRLPDED